MAMYMLKHRDFTFDTEKDLQDLYDNNCKMFNQRDLTNALLSDEGGDKISFLNWVDKHSNYLPARKQMLHAILDPWVPPVVADPTDAAVATANEQPSTDNAPAAAPTKKSGSFEDEFGGDGIETDTLLSGTGHGLGTVTAQEARQRLANYDFTL
jgi:hypothetical protein